MYNLGGDVQEKTLKYYLEEPNSFKKKGRNDDY
jgi:hypothetical protein